jgi:hypothetical protein
MLDIRYSITACDLDNSKYKYDLGVLRYAVEGDFAIYVGEQVFFAESSFPLIGFALGAMEWLHIVRSTQQALMIEIDEMQEPAIFWAKQRDQAWYIGSSYQEFDVQTPFTQHDIEKVLQDYVDRLAHQMEAEYGVPLQILLEKWAENRPLPRRKVQGKQQHQWWKKWIKW